MTLSSSNSWHDDRFSDSLGRNSSQRVFAAVLKNKLDGRSETFAALFNGAALPVRAGNLWTVGDISIAIALNDGSKLIVHKNLGF
jgi:hypothetical protein